MNTRTKARTTISMRSNRHRRIGANEPEPNTAAGTRRTHAGLTQAAGWHNRKLCHVISSKLTSYGAKVNIVITQASNTPPTLYELPHELRGVRVCLRPDAVGDGVAVQEAIEESRDHLRPWMAWTDSRRTVQECETYVRQALARWITQEDITVG